MAEPKLYKICTICNRELQLTQFHKMTAGKYGVHSQCIECVRARRRQQRSYVRPANLAGEEWRPVVGWEGVYSVSNMGRVVRVAHGSGTHPGLILIPHPDTHGYPVVKLSRNNEKCKRSVHSIVAEAFIGPRGEGLEVNHINGIVTDARLENLEYITHAANIKHAADRLGGWRKNRNGRK